MVGLMFFIPLIFIPGDPVGWGIYGAWSSGLVFVAMLWRYRRG